jgi:hypothetical protein
MLALLCATNPLWEYILFPLLFIGFGAFLGHVFQRITSDSRLARLSYLCDDLDDDALISVRYDDQTDGIRIIGVENPVSSKPYNWEDEK